MKGFSVHHPKVLRQMCTFLSNFQKLTNLPSSWQICEFFDKSVKAYLPTVQSNSKYRFRPQIKNQKNRWNWKVFALKIDRRWIIVFCSLLNNNGNTSRAFPNTMDSTPKSVSRIVLSNYLPFLSFSTTPCSTTQRRWKPFDRKSG